MLRGVRVVEGADLERLCGATHRGFESLPLSHINSQISLKSVITAKLTFTNKHFVIFRPRSVRDRSKKRMRMAINQKGIQTY